MATAAYYDRVSQALGNLTNQLNINASRNLEREQLGLRSLNDTTQMMMAMDQNRRANESQQAQLKYMESGENRANAAEGRTQKQFDLSLPGWKFNSLKFQNAMDESDVNVSKWFSANPYVADKVRKNPKFQQDIASIYGDNATLNPENFTIVDKNTNKPLRMTGFEQSNRAYTLLGTALSHIDPAAGIQSTADEIETKVQGLQAQYRTISDKDVGAKAAIASELAKSKLELNKANQQLNPMNLLSFYRRKDNLLRNVAVVSDNSGGSPAMMNLLSNSIAENSRAMQALQTSILKSTGGSGEKSQQQWAVQVDKNGKIQNSVLLNAPKSVPSGMIPATIDPRLKPEDGWQWSKQADYTRKATNEGMKGELTKNQIMGLIGQAYGSKNVTGQYIQTRGTVTSRMNAERAVVDIIKGEPDLGGIAHVNKAVDWADKIEKDYHKNYTSIFSTPPNDVQKQLRDAGKEVSETNINLWYKNNFDQLNSWWKKESYIKDLPKVKRNFRQIEMEEFYEKERRRNK